MNQLIHKDETDAILQQRLRNDDRNALEIIYTKYKETFFSFAKTYTIGTQDALDIYQDAVIALFQNFVTKQLVLDKSSIKTYLFAIGKHKIYKFLNHKNRPLPNIDSKEDLVTEIDFDDNTPTELQLQLAKNLKQLSGSCNELLRLYYYRGLTIDEIVARTDYKDANTVKSRKSKCIKYLKTLFKIT